MPASARRGAAGAAGAVTPFVYVQATPSATWAVSHNLGREVAAVTVLSADGDEIDVGVHPVDLNLLEIRMEPALACSGKAIVL